MEIVVGKDLKDKEILELISKIIRLNQVIKIRERYYRRERASKGSKFTEVEMVSESDIIIKINTDDIRTKRKFTSFGSLGAAQRYINTYSSNDRRLKYEFNLDGFVVYK